MAVRPSRPAPARCLVALGLSAVLTAGVAAPAAALHHVPSAPVAIAATAGTLAAAPTDAQIQGYINSVYLDLFGREADPSGLATWTTALRTGTPRVEVANAITASREFRTGLVAFSYAAYLDRLPEQAGLEHWLGQLRLGLTISQLEAGFISSEEYYLQVGSDAETWVQRLYLDVLDREAAPAEIGFWADLLAAGATRYDVAMGFLLSTEHLTTVVDGTYQHLLGRGLDPAGLRTWVGVLQAGGRDEAIIGGIIASEEYWSNLG